MIRALFGLIFWILGELKTLLYILLHPVKGKTHKERLESFYTQQAANYDSFRKKLLHGREDMLKSVPQQKNGVWIDMGGGTGFNIEQMDNLGKLSQFSKVYIVDLSTSLLEVARKRRDEKGWKNVEIVEADATTFRPAEAGKIDLITFSYSLTMIPDWFLALEHAKTLLKPKTGLIGVVDFYVARKYPAEGFKQHAWLQRFFWQTWFSFDNVNLNPDHLPWLNSHLKKVHLDERWGPVPYLTFLSTPHYIYIGANDKGDH